MTNRRQFIKLSIAGVATAGVAYVGIKAVTPFQKMIAEVLSADLKELKINSEDIIKFSSKAAETNPWGYSGTKVKFIALYHYLDKKWLPLPYKYKYVQYRADIVGRFLLSTDFFKNKMDESKPINYLGTIYSPYNTTCSNPFTASYYKL